jgi:hypothetical protein
MNETRKVHMLSQVGIEMRLPDTRFFVIEIKEYLCIKSFGEIEEGITVWGGFHPKKSAMFIDEAGFGEDIPIGHELFYEHFEEDCGAPIHFMHIPEVMREETKRLKNKRRFS